MPNRDGTGPSGDGRQGRGLGSCGQGRDIGIRQRSGWLDIIRVIVNIISQLPKGGKNAKS